MHVTTILQKLLSTSIHKTRLKGLTPVIVAIIKSKKLKLTQLGRSLGNKAKERSGIRRIDKLLANFFYQMNAIKIYKSLCSFVIGNKKHPDIIVDWSSLPNSQSTTEGGEHCVLRATYAAEGRGITLYEEVHPKKNEGSPKVHKAFLQRLKSILPEDCRPCILTDAGFKNPWFQAVSALGWDYVGRLRGLVHYSDDNTKFKPISDLFSQASTIPKYLGSYFIAKSNVFQCNVYLYKGKAKGRYKLTKTKKRATDKDSKKHSKANREPWLLVSSLAGDKFAKRVVKKYKMRMTIEENFRDTKSIDYGLNLNRNQTIKPKRYIVWLMLAALASLIAWIVGYVGEQLNLQYDFQANTYKHRRVLSFFFLGCQIIRKKIDIPIHFETIQFCNKRCAI
jgi:hypothetical protein